ncbi:MAG: hypothetical protein HY804_01950 [Nitrospinae bacterium]|nr:hypothetical protein [Nitrospinota bacterium]
MATIVKINGETAQIGLEGIENLSALVEKVASERFGPKEIINEIYVNDRALADDEIQAAALGIKEETLLIIMRVYRNYMSLDTPLSGEDTTRASLKARSGCWTSPAPCAKARRRATG